LPILNAALVQRDIDISRAALYREANSFLLGGDQAPWPHHPDWMRANIRGDVHVRSHFRSAT
jgi:hypothetical protein